MNPAQVVLITGCSSGFGRLTAETLARKHYQVFATMRAVQERNAHAAHELRALAERESLQLHVLELDVTDDASVRLPARINAQGDFILAGACGVRPQVCDRHLDVVLTRLRLPGELEIEGHVRKGGTQLGAVDESTAVVVNSVEMNEHSLAYR